MSGATQILVQNVCKSFGRVCALDNVSLEIGHGEFFSLLGASGCGKTTLLRILAGFEEPTDGAVWIDGEDMSGVPPYRRPTNMVFQNYAMFPHLDVRGNIGYGLRKERLSAEALDERVRAALSMIKMEGYGDRRVDQLSGGQQQRVALARALVKRPKVLLLDEPLGALDKKLREQMQIELRSLQQKVGVSFVFVTHDQEEALTMSDRIAVMSGGRVLQVDTPSSLYDAPNCREVAEFIGHMNFFEGRVSSIAGGEVIMDAGPGIGILRAKEQSLGGCAGSRVTFAIRPEKVVLSGSRPKEESNVISGTLVNMAYFGNRATYFVEVPNREEPVTVVTQDLERFANNSIRSGQEVWLSLATRSLVVLPDSSSDANPDETWTTPDGLSGGVPSTTYNAEDFQNEDTITGTATGRSR